MKKKKCPKCSCKETRDHFRINEKLAKDLTKQFKANEAYKKKTKGAHFGEY